MDVRKVERWRHLPNAKTSLFKPQPEFLQEFGDIVAGLMKWIARAPLYDAANWLLHQNRWLNAATTVTGIKVGDVLDVEFGVGFQEEFSYRHPGLVLNKLGRTITVVPMTSKASGKGIVVDAAGGTSGPTDPDPKYAYRVEFTPPGGTDPSILLVDQVRTICETRVLGTRADIIVPQHVRNVVQQRLVLMAAPDFHGEFTDVKRDRNKLQRKFGDLKRQFAAVKTVADRVKELEAHVNDLEKEKLILEEQLGRYKLSS